VVVVVVVVAVVVVVVVVAAAVATVGTYVHKCSSCWSRLVTTRPTHDAFTIPVYFISIHREAGSSMQPVCRSGTIVLSVIQFRMFCVLVCYRENTELKHT
jgi:hypothetical protein